MAVIADDKTDVSNHLQNVVVFRYIVSGTVVERFWSFCNLPQGNAENISINVISCLNSILPGVHDKQKLVAHCYDGASVWWPNIIMCFQNNFWTTFFTFHSEVEFNISLPFTL